MSYCWNVCKRNGINFHIQIVGGFIDFGYFCLLQSVEVWGKYTEDNQSWNWNTFSINLLIFMFMLRFSKQNGYQSVNTAQPQDTVDDVACITIPCRSAKAAVSWAAPSKESSLENTLHKYGSQKKSNLFKTYKRKSLQINIVKNVG